MDGHYNLNRTSDLVVKTVNLRLIIKSIWEIRTTYQKQ